MDKKQYKMVSSVRCRQRRIAKQLGIEGIGTLKEAGITSKSALQEAKQVLAETAQILKQKAAAIREQVKEAMAEFNPESVRPPYKDINGHFCSRKEAIKAARIRFRARLLSNYTN